jgi:hypothetical protein
MGFLAFPLAYIFGGLTLVIISVLLDAELFTKRNVICLKAKQHAEALPSVTKEMKLGLDEVRGPTQLNKVDAKAIKTVQGAEREEAFDFSTPWYIFIRSVTDMEDWYHAIVHAATHPSQTNALQPLDFARDLASHLDSQPDPIPMRWLNAFIGDSSLAYIVQPKWRSISFGLLMKNYQKSNVQDSSAVSLCWMSPSDKLPPCSLNLCSRS